VGLRWSSGAVIKEGWRLGLQDKRAFPAGRKNSTGWKIEKFFKTDFRTQRKSYLNLKKKRTLKIN